MAKQLMEVELNGVIYRPGEALAIFGGELLQVGDAVLGGLGRVESIGPKEIRIGIGDEMITKRLVPYRRSDVSPMQATPEEAVGPSSSEVDTAPRDVSNSEEGGGG